jgi:hypothetical protein
MEWTREQIKETFELVEQCKQEKGIDVVPSAIERLWEKDGHVRAIVMEKLWDMGIYESSRLRYGTELFLDTYRNLDKIKEILSCRS